MIRSELLLKKNKGKIILPLFFYPLYNNLKNKKD